MAQELREYISSATSEVTAVGTPEEIAAADAVREIMLRSWHMKRNNERRRKMRPKFLDRCGCLPLLALLACLLGAAPRAVITSDIEEGSEVTPGEFIDLDASESTEATLFLWLVEPANIDGKVTSRVSADGKQLQIASRPGIYRVQLIVANAEGIAQTKRTINVGKQQPAPTPQPVVPDIPAGKFGFARDIVAWSSLVTSQHDKAAALAASYASIAAQTAAGKYRSIQEAVTATKNANNQILDVTAKAAWTPLLTKLSEKLAALEKDGKLLSTSELVLAWLEIADGLSRLKK